MVLVEDDTILHPEIDDDVFSYINGLNEGHAVYTRFFDALLIKRNSHRSFFHDLKAFREQPQVISLLERASVEKKIYKEVTFVFLESRFAHPWCRKIPLRKGFWRAEWGSIQGKQRNGEIAKEEARLHKLLVPIWIIMRSRMFPDEEVVKAWCIQERERLKNKEPARLTLNALQLHDRNMERDSLRVEETPTRPLSDSGLDDEEREAAAQVATSIFRLAAAGALLSQQPKRKLRWLVKKPL